MQIVCKPLSSDFYGTRCEWLVDGEHNSYHLMPQFPTLTSGDYVLFHYFSPNHGFEVLRFYKVGDDAWNQAHPDEVHPGNLYVDTTGCSLCGIAFGLIDCSTAYKEGDHRHNLKGPDGSSNVPGIVGSRTMFKRLIAEIPDATPIKVLGLGE
jgi:hypothetical protein